ncbi:hypothetical protein AWC18_16785 [Mycolicibacter nonchromogenicus]|uniref:Uncharacterized protein n=1 Tax=Mycolicibacter nonchromogenicus TaxID=1782 RepID=A0A1X1Z2X1_MYCNO|nr:hypothetical protein AWC18_16785 [Mycolicibacter nonchromogenicus]
MDSNTLTNSAEALTTAPDTFDLFPLTIDGWFADMAVMSEPDVDGFFPLADAPVDMGIDTLLSGVLTP